MLNLFYHLPGEPGVFQTVYMMRDLVNRTYAHPWIRERAEEVTQGCGRDPRCDHAALTSFVESTVRFLKDPSGIEALHHPVSFYEKRLRSGRRLWGDCDDMATYLAALLKSIGHKPMFRVVGKDRRFHHVLVVCEGESLDPSMGVGQYPRAPGRVARVPI